MSERLWAGWRMAYIRSAAGKEVPEEGGACLFCSLAAAAPGVESLVLERYERTLLVMNAFPYNSGHVMIAPIAHTDLLTAGDAPTGTEMLAAAERARRVLEREYAPDGFNAGVNLGRAAGAGVPGHLHWHLVPRWNGDTNFMPAVADARVLPESLSDTYGRLMRALAAFPAHDLTVVRRGEA